MRAQSPYAPEVRGAPLRAQSPYDFAEVLHRFRTIAEQRRTALAAWEQAIQKAADEEAEYSKQYAKAIVTAAGSTVAEREATARATTADQRARRDVARDMKDVWKERVRGLEGERANLNGLAQWSRSLEPGIGG